MRDRRALVSAAAAVLLLIVGGLVLTVHSLAAPFDEPRFVAGCGSAGPSPAAGCPGAAAITLRSLASRRGLLIGSAANAQALSQDPQYAAVLGREFDAVTAEDAMKWSRVEPQAGQYDWSGADRVIDFARRNHQKIYGHSLLWYASTPGWLTTSGLTGPQIAARTEQHITDEVTRYRGQVWAWDMVNEPLTDDGKLRSTAWSQAMGPGWIATAFRLAHSADPQAELFLNEFGADTLGAKSDALYQLVRRLLAEGVPIDGVGFQSHLNLTSDTAHRLDNLRRFAALGLDVAITEADVRILLPATAVKLQKQAEVYRRMMQDCLAVTRCVSFTVWGFTDRYSWIPDLQPNAGAACLFDAELGSKPAYTAVAAALSDTS